MGRRKFTAEFKRKVVIEAMRGDETVRAIAARYSIHPNQLSQWKTQAHDGLLDVFDKAGGNPAARETDKLIEQLYARIGELVVERDFFRRVPRSGKRPEGKVHSGRRNPAADPQV